MNFLIKIKMVAELRVGPAWPHFQHYDRGVQQLHYHLWAVQRKVGGHICVNSWLIICSIFLRNCANCLLLAACQQFRASNCQNMEAHLNVSTQPVCPHIAFAYEIQCEILRICRPSKRPTWLWRHCWWATRKWTVCLFCLLLLIETIVF